MLSLMFNFLTSVFKNFLLLTKGKKERWGHSAIPSEIFSEFWKENLLCDVETFRSYSFAPPQNVVLMCQLFVRVLWHVRRAKIRFYFYCRIIDLLHSIIILDLFSTNLFSHFLQLRENLADHGLVRSRQFIRLLPTHLTLRSHLTPFCARSKKR